MTHSKNAAPRHVGTTLGLLPTIALSTAFALPAQAQSEQTVELDTIVVQGNSGETEGYLAVQNSNAKATAPIEDTPQTITTVTKEVMQERGLTSVEDVLRSTPGVTLQAGEGGNPMGTAPVIRGFDANADISVDGIRNSSRVSYETFNLESVQITKGASGATTGRGGTGGTINLDTKRALAEDFTDVTATVGTGNLLRGTLDLNRQISETAAFRLNVMRQTADDLNGRVNQTSDRLGVAPTLSLQVGDRTKVNIGAYYYEMHDLPDYGLAFSNANTADRYRVGSGTSSDPYRPVDVDNETWYGVNNRDFRDNITKSVYANVEHGFDSGATFSTTLRYTEDKNVYLTTKPNAGYGTCSVTYSGRQNETNCIGAGGTYTVQDDVVEAQTRSGNRVTRTVALNAQLSGSSRALGVQHDYAVGLDLSREITESGSVSVTGDANPLLSFENPYNNIAWSGSIDVGERSETGRTVTKSVYAFDTITFSPKWEASLGLRYDMFTSTGMAGRGSSATEVEETQNILNGSIGVVYHPVDNVSVYASVGSSAEPALSNAGIQTDSANPESVDLDPERSYTYEVGAKWLVNPNLLVGGSVYRIQKQNERAQVDGEWVLASQESHSQGLELTFAGQITDKLGISGGYALIEYSADDGDTDFTRNVPKHAFNVWGSYDLNDDWSFGAGATYTGERHPGSSDTQVIPSSWQVDVMAQYNITDTTTAQLNVTNLFDEDIYGSSHFGQFVNMGPARTIALTVGTSF